LFINSIYGSRFHSLACYEIPTKIVKYDIDAIRLIGYCDEHIMTLETVVEYYFLLKLNISYWLYFSMEFNLTAKDKHALKKVAIDLQDMLNTKKGEAPDYEFSIDLSFFKQEGRGLDAILEWVEDFRKRMDDAEKKQSKEELDLEEKELVNAGWIARLS